MLVGFTGIRSNGVGVDTVGDNLANVNTTAFKAQRALFETLLYQTISGGEAPSATSGGTNPRQIGAGSGVASIQRNFNQGGLDSTGFPSDLAIEGDGFFVIDGPDDSQVYTRDGSFRLDATQTMVTAGGGALQVYDADDAGNIQTGALTNLVIPLGTASAAVATQNVLMNGQLDSNTGLATQGAVVTSQPLVTTSGAASESTQLTSLVDAAGVPLFATGDELQVTASKGGISIQPSTFIVGTTGATVGELATYLQDVLGIDTDPALGDMPGVTVSDGAEFPAGSLVIRSNPGEINAAELGASSIVNVTGLSASPISFTTVEEAVGEGVSTSFGVFDSLGNLVEVRLRASLESKSDAGSTWRFFAESENDSDLSPLLGTGTISFDPNGQFVAATGTDISIDGAGGGAATPLAFTLDVAALTGLASANGQSELIMASQDGTPAGIMTGYSIDDVGVVTAAHSNQQTQVLGQIPLATFRNNEGLVALSENTFAEGNNSGPVNVVLAQTGVAGAIRAGALEQANVEIAREFINLIQSSTGISSASRVVRVADQLLQELLLLAR